MSNASKPTNDLPELFPMPVSTKLIVFAGTVIMAGYVAALIFQAANIF
jgi:hypothetical protein